MKRASADAQIVVGCFKTGRKAVRPNCLATAGGSGYLDSNPVKNCRHFDNFLEEWIAGFV